jgi:hypothetical protein
LPKSKSVSPKARTGKHGKKEINRDGQDEKQCRRRNAAMMNSKQLGFQLPFILHHSAIILSLLKAWPV